jgi:Mn-dependent DtxR family transcriptional regulator
MPTYETHESAEMYLKTIYILRKTKPEVHSIDVSEYMNYSKPSVSRGIHILEQEGYLVVNENKALVLTEKGLSHAERIYNIHEVVTKALIHMGVSQETAESDACKIEHDISDETYNALKKFIQ